jgi:hypothetical protein
MLVFTERIILSFRLMCMPLAFINQPHLLIVSQTMNISIVLETTYIFSLRPCDSIIVWPFVRHFPGVISAIANFFLIYFDTKM